MQTVHIIHDNLQWTSTQSTTSFSAHGVGSPNLPSFHHARTASSCIQCALTTRLASEDAVSNNIRKSEAQSSVAGSEMTMTSSPLNGWGSPAPEAVLQLLLCKRSRRCKLPECQCMSNGLKCTKLCKLQTCDNQPQEGTLTRLSRRQT